MKGKGVGGVAYHASDNDYLFNFELIRKHFLYVLFFRTTSYRTC